MKVLSRIAFTAMTAVFVGATLGAMWIGLPNETISEGAAIFTIAFLAAIAASLAFVKSNQQSIEKVIYERDRSALRRMIFGKGRGTRD